MCTRGNLNIHTKYFSSTAVKAAPADKEQKENIEQKEYGYESEAQEIVHTEDLPKKKD